VATNQTGPKVKIVPTQWYDAGAAAALLGASEDTVKKRCREGTLVAKQVGFKRRWHVKGTSIVELRKKLNLDLD